MPYTYFLIASESKIAQLQTVDDVCKVVEETEPLLGWAGDFTLEGITNLCQIFLKEEKGIPVSTDYVWKDGSRFYTFDEKLCKKVAATDWNDILEASVPWSEGEPWKNLEHNRMDLAGLIIDFAALCKKVNDKDHLYFLISNED